MGTIASRLVWALDYFGGDIRAYPRQTNHNVFASLSGSAASTSDLKEQTANLSLLKEKLQVRLHRDN